MKMIEALQKLKDGKIIASSAGGKTLAIKFENGSIKYKDPAATAMWFHSDLGKSLSIEEILNNNQEWHIYEEPNTYWRIEHKIFSDEKSFAIGMSTSKFPAKNENEALQWLKALETFFELKCHPLRCPLTEGFDLSQYQIILNDNGEGDYFIDTDYLEFGYEKISLISPIFENDKNVIQAIQDIGEQRLIHMFKTFQGIYE